MKWVGRAVLGVVLVATAGRQLRDFLHMIVQGIYLLQYVALSYTHVKVLHDKPHTIVLCEREIMESQHSVPRRMSVRDRDTEILGG
jgi:hypothetical protein